MRLELTFKCGLYKLISRLILEYRRFLNSYTEVDMKPNLIWLSLFLLPTCFSLFAEVNQIALSREISHIERSADELMKQVLKVGNRALRRKLTADIDRIYESAERMRLLVSEKDSLPKPIREGDLQEFILALKDASFSDARVDMIAEFVHSNWFRVVQVGQMIEEISFGEDKVRAILTVYPHIVDPENSYLLFEYVTFSDDRAKLKKGLMELQAANEADSTNIINESQ